ncbi:MAG: tetratricopeptide repeat protein [Lachnospiraceae bacterium]|nr:tetratricopeptide repeat protein [Lachnospiraceae bacterium]
MEFNRKKYNILIVLMLLMLVVCLAVFACFAVCGARIGLNSFFVLMSEKDKYPVDAEEKAAKIEFIDKYITTYNLANAEYANGNYENALEMYEQVLDDNVTGRLKGRTCVNLSLSRTKTIDFDDIYERFDDFEDGKETDVVVLVDKINQAIKVLENAKKDLSDNGCVGEEGTLDLSIPQEELDEAAKLDEDIDKEIEELKKMLEKLQPPSSGGDSGNDDNNDGGGGSSGGGSGQSSGNSGREDEVKNQLEQQQSRTKEEQTQAQDDFKEDQYWNGKSEGSGGSGDEGGQGESGNDSKSW